MDLHNAVRSNHNDTASVTLNDVLSTDAQAVADGAINTGIQGLADPPMGFSENRYLLEVNGTFDIHFGLQKALDLWYVINDK